MVYTYTYSRVIYDLENLFHLLQNTFPKIKSLTSNPHQTHHYVEPHEVTVYTDIELTNQEQTDLQTFITDYANPMHPIDVNSFRKISYINSTTIPLYPNCTFEGHWEDISNYSTISVWVKCDNDSAPDGLEIHYSTDADETEYKRPITVKGNVGTRNQFVVMCRYFKIKFINGSNLNDIKIQTIFHHYRNKTVGTRLISTLHDGADCDVVRSVVNGRLENGSYIPIDITSQGYLKTSIQDPLSSFGCVTIANNTPVFQYDFVYSNFKDEFNIFTNNSGYITNSNNMITCSSGSNTNSSALYMSKKHLKYRSGQGSLCRFTAVFDQSVAGNSQFIGVGNFETLLGFGYQDSNFGIIYAPKNRREQCTITITEPSMHNQNISLTLGGNSYVIPVSSNASKQSTAWEISQFDFNSNSYPAWEVSASDSNIDIIAIESISLPNDYAISFPSSGNAIISRNIIGTTQSNILIQQKDWNIDTLDGSGTSTNPSAILLNPQKGNLYHIKFQYLGFGFIEFGLENPNTSEQIPVHRDYYANKNLIPSLHNPHVSFIMNTINNQTCSNDTTLSCACCVAFTQGEIYKNAPKFSIQHEKTNISTASIPIFSIRNTIVYNDRPNYLEVFLYQINITNTSNNFANIIIMKNPKLDNKTNFQNINDHSFIQKDTSAESFVNGVELYNLTIPPNKFKSICIKDYSMYLLPNDIITIVAKSLSNTTDIVCSILVQQDE